MLAQAAFVSLKGCPVQASSLQAEGHCSGLRSLRDGRDARAPRRGMPLVFLQLNQYTKTPLSSA